MIPSTKGLKMPRVIVRCSWPGGCDMMVDRDTRHKNDARCDHHEYLHGKEVAKARRMRERSHSRRYRILCHYLGWEDPEDWTALLSWVKTFDFAAGKPEGWAAVCDVSWDKKHRRRRCA